MFPFQNDSGVDMSNIKLPELPGPPTPANNLYSTLKKLKNFVTIKKSPKTKGKIYESTQFYVPSSTSASTPQLNVQALEPEPSTFYENITLEASKSVAEKVKPKGSNRIKTKLRKSLVIFDSNSNLNTPTSEAKSTFYTTSSESSQNLSTSESTIPKKFSTLVKKSKFSKAQRRKTATDITIPVPIEEPVYENKMKSSTSWYTECGVFKNNLPNAAVMPSTIEEKSSNGHTSWYAEVGLYQANGSPSSSADSSSGISTSGEGTSYENAHNVFPNEPLYQIYNAAKVESITRDMEEDRTSSFDGYEEIGKSINLINNNTPPVPPMRRRSRPTALQLVNPKLGPSRTLWSEIPEVKTSQILCKYLFIKY